MYPLRFGIVFPLCSVVFPLDSARTAAQTVTANGEQQAAEKPVATKDRALKPVEADLQAAAAQGRRWALLIGIEKYEHVPQLDYCGDDVRLLRGTLVKHAGYLPEHVHVLSDDAPGSRSPSKGNILIELTTFLREARAEDTVLLAFSGHGELDKDGNAYLVPIDGNSDLLEDTCILVKRLHELLARCPAQRKVVILDACHAGGKKGPDDTSFDLTAMPPGKGLIELLSCSRQQVSYEDATIKHGVFSRFLADALQGLADVRPDGNENGFVSVEEAYLYVLDRVSRHTKGKQSPVIRRGEVEGQLTLAVRPSELASSTLPDEVLSQRLQERKARSKISEELFAEAGKWLTIKTDFAPARDIRLVLSLVARGVISEAEFRTLAAHRFPQLQSHLEARERSKQAKLHILAIGIDKFPHYLDGKAIFDGSVNDTRLMRQILLQQAGSAVGTSVVLVNEQATEEAVVKALGDVVEQCLPDDVLLVLYAGAHTRFRLSQPENPSRGSQLYESWLLSEFTPTKDIPFLEASVAKLPAAPNDGVLLVNQIAWMVDGCRGHVVVICDSGAEGTGWPTLAASYSIDQKLNVKVERITGKGSRLWLGSSKPIELFLGDKGEAHGSLEFLSAQALSGQADIATPRFFALQSGGLAPKGITVKEIWVRTNDVEQSYLDRPDGFVTLRELGTLFLRYQTMKGIAEHFQVHGSFSERDVVLTRSTLPVD